MNLEKSGYARAASQAFHEAATMYQCFLDFNLEDQDDANTDNNNNGSNSNKAMTEDNEFAHVTSNSVSEVKCLLGYISVRLAHLSHDAMGDSKAAVRLYRDAVRIDPLPSSVSWHGVGTSLESATAGAELGEAIEAYRMARKLAPGSYRIAFDLAVALERSSKRSAEEMIGREISFSEGKGGGDAEDSDGNLVLLKESEKIMEQLRRGGADANSLVDSWGYVRWHMRKTPDIELNLHRGTRDMLKLALDAARPLIDFDKSKKQNGLVCEFGVASGRSMRMTKEILPLEVAAHGFDTFTGLPQAWGSEPAGSYSTGGVIPRVEGTVFFHKGLFSETIPPFLKENPNVPLAFANIDCDLYSSTYDILELLHNRIVPGTVLIFDEYICHPTWRQDEFRAWRECCKRFGWTYEYLAFSLSSKQTVVRVISA